MSEYKVPCGRITGHGENCIKEALCSACTEIERLQQKAQEFIYNHKGTYVVKLAEDGKWITNAQIDAAVKRANKFEPVHGQYHTFLWKLLNILGIERCSCVESTGKLGQWDDEKNCFGPCPDCNGHRWVKK